MAEWWVDGSEIALGERSEETVIRYFERANTPEIRIFLPQQAKTVEEALADYRETLLPDASSFGRTIFADGVPIGDIWCYGIQPGGEPEAMLSYCIYEPEYQQRGIAATAVGQFLTEAAERFSIRIFGAFTYAENLPSIRVLEKNGFLLEEQFEEDGRLSRYYRLCLSR